MNTETKWATIEEPAVLELSSHCNCDDEPSGCDGYACYYPIKEDLEENIFPEFLARNNSPSYLKIVGAHMGWQRRTGYKFIPADFKELFESLTINGDWTLSFTLAADSLAVGRFSHDEPTGAYFVVNVATEDEYEEATR